jgi:hypothetical protein
VHGASIQQNRFTRAGDIIPPPSKSLALILSILLVTFVHIGGQQVARPEFPQPQFQRDEWLTLNGTWQFELDDKNVGLDEQWASGKRAFGRSITVPFPFEARLSGIGDTSFHPWIWYRRTFTVPPGWKGGGCCCASAPSTIRHRCG